MLKKEVKEYLEEIDCSTEVLKDYKVAGKIREFIKPEDEKSLEDNAEIFAFNVYTDVSGSTSWNLYFGPMTSFVNKQGKEVDFPSLDLLSNETLEYWSARLNESSHPYLKARYADLLIEFKDHYLSKIDPGIFNVAIDSHILLSKQDGLEDIFAKQELERAFQLAKIYQQKEKLSSIFELAVNLESRIAQDDKAGLWGFVLEWFLLDVNFNPPKTIVEDYIKSFEERRLRLLKSSNIGPLKHCTLALARYHKFKCELSKVESVLHDYENCIRQFSEFNESSFGRLHYLQNLEEVYLQFDDSPALKENLRVIQNELSNFRLDPTDDEFKEISVTQEIPKEKINKLLKGIFDRDTLPEVILRIVLNFFQRVEREAQSFEEYNNRFVFAQITSGKVFDLENRLIATLPPLSEAPELHFIKHCNQNLQICSVFLSLVLDKFREEYEDVELIKIMKSSGLHSKSDDLVIETLVSLYWRKEYFTFVHVAVPFVESSLRRLFTTSGMATQRLNKKIGGYEYRPINKLLQDPHAELVFKQISNETGPDLLHTINMIFTEKLGLNIRNNLAHGIYQADFYSRKYSDQILLIILILSLIKIKE
jgi:hypothetical protein